MKHTVLGVLDSRRRATVDGAGHVVLAGGATLDWWVGAEDRRHHPGREAAVRQRRLGPGPVLETSMRVPGGDAIQRVYAAGGPADLVVMEVENASPVPFAVGFVVRRRLLQRRRPDLELPRPPLREESEGDEHALVYPVAHRTRIRVGVVLGRRAGAIDLTALPAADDITRGWEAQLRRGLRVDLPDDQLQQAVEEARADVLLTGRDVAPLEDWGFDDEAAAAWSSLGFRARRWAQRRSHRSATWSEVEQGREQGGASLLAPLRSMLVHEAEDGVALLSELPPSWVGQPLEVHDAPTRAAGRVSFAVRWHGDRPALLWECERLDATVRAPGLDRAWSTPEPSGDALLGRSVDA